MLGCTNSSLCFLLHHKGSKLEVGSIWFGQWKSPLLWLSEIGLHCETHWTPGRGNGMCPAHCRFCPTSAASLNKWARTFPHPKLCSVWALSLKTWSANLEILVNIEGPTMYMYIALRCAFWTPFGSVNAVAMVTKQFNDFYRKPFFAVDYKTCINSDYWSG